MRIYHSLMLLLLALVQNALQRVFMLRASAYILTLQTSIGSRKETSQGYRRHADRRRS